jgi:hypothetical protein
MGEDQDYILDLGGQRDRQASSAGDASGKTSRPYISVHFDCCGVYTRVYRNQEGTAYVGWCPKCAKKVSVKIGSEGTNCRFFRAT